MSGMLDNSEFTRRRGAAEAAQNEGEYLALNSRLQKVEGLTRNDLTWNDIVIQEPIGFGGFSHVFRAQLADNPEQDYAVKCLNPQTKLRSKSYRTGAVDLAIEAEILSRLEHENVIRLHGVSAGGPLQAFMETEKGFFLVLDILEDTLSNKLAAYRAVYNTGTSKTSSSNQGSSKYMTQSSVLERVSSVAMGVAQGMEYLHSQGVALRDLKPDNVGFDSNGTPKIFDLGFAREEHTIRPTEVAGSLRYMAPEVALGQGSRLASDVYSFGVLLWEICTLEKPYKRINSRDEFMDKVMVDKWRPSTSKIPSNALRKLIKECWQTDPKKRPAFPQIVKKLRVELSLANAVPTKNKGFGSTVNLKRTATWTAKKLSSGISNSSFGMLRIGFNKSGNTPGRMESVGSGLARGLTKDGSPGMGGKNASFEKPSGVGGMLRRSTSRGTKKSLIDLKKGVLPSTISEAPNSAAP